MQETIRKLAKEAKRAARKMASAGTEPKNAVLLDLAGLLEQEKERLFQENERDLEYGREKGLSSAMLDRLRLSDATVQSMVMGLREVAGFSDPVGEITKSWLRPNGLQVGKMRIPLGVILMIYESRPNVTVDAAALCLKAGNAVILRGGSEAFHSNTILGSLIGRALEKNGLPPQAVQLVPVRDREAVNELLRREEEIDLVIPRGGEGLIRFVVENSRIPVLKHYKGVCHVYVDHGADLSMAREIAVNAKAQRPGVCNALETLLVHRDEADAFLPDAGEALKQAGVEIRGCPETLKRISGAKAATDTDWGREFSDLILAVRVVADMDEAMDHIALYGSLHTEAIVTRDYARARRFLREVDASVVLVNASTRFNDGGQLGLGAEIGISTSKLHAFGPMGIEELTATKFVVMGDGQIRS